MSGGTSSSREKGAALVFGASGEQGRAAVEGLVDNGYDPVYTFTREDNVDSNTYLTDALGAVVWHGDVGNPDHVERALRETKAAVIFLVTTTEFPLEMDDKTTTTGAFSNAAESEYQVIVEFVHILKQVHMQDDARTARHLVFSTRDNVQRVTREVWEKTGQVWIEPLEDGSVVPHYSAKGRGGEYALQYLQGVPNLRLTLLTLPFLFSNFLGFFTPLPNEGKTQWTLAACLGDGSNKIDMMSASDLSFIIPNIVSNPEKYDGKNLRLVGQQISMDEIAKAFSDLFGKDVIYNPLTADEVGALPFPTAPVMAQMCQFISDPRSLRHSVDETVEVCYPQHPRTFTDWLVTHSDSTAFQTVGLEWDAPEILYVTVFGATSPEGTSVVKGLLQDKRKRYKVRATSRHVHSEAAQQIHAFDAERVEVVYADYDDLESCQKAVDGVDGVFLVTDFYQDANQDMEAEERHAKNIIDACESSATVKHLVFSTFESVDEMNKLLDLGLTPVKDSKGNAGTIIQIDAKARAAAYARTKNLSVTYVLMPCYSELFFDMIERRKVVQANGDEHEKLVLTMPLKDDTKVMCMSVEDLGPAVATIFDSYQVYAGHEIGLVTDFVTVAEVKDMIEEVFLQTKNKDGEEKATVAIETELLSKEDWIQEKETYMKDLGQMFAYMAHTDAVQGRRSIAKTLKLVPSAKPLRQWIEENANNDVFLEKLGLRTT